jgi:hypothetical protein
MTRISFSYIQFKAVFKEIFDLGSRIDLDMDRTTSDEQFHLWMRENYPNMELEEGENVGQSGTKGDIDTGEGRDMTPCTDVSPCRNCYHPISEHDLSGCKHQYWDNTGCVCIWVPDKGITVDPLNVPCAHVSVNNQRCPLYGQDRVSLSMCNSRDCTLYEPMSIRPACSHSFYAGTARPLCNMDGKPCIAHDVTMCSDYKPLKRPTIDCPSCGHSIYMHTKE